MSERLRELFLNPLEADAIARPLIHELGVDITMQENPAFYREQLKAINPRYTNSKGETRSISRQDVQEKAHLMTDGSLATALFSTCDALGITEPSYPFDDFANDAEAIVVTGGVYTALKQRTAFAMTGPKRPVYIVGGPRKVGDQELAQLEKDGVKYGDVVREKDLAHAVASTYADADRPVQVLEPRALKPDNLDALREFVLTNPKIKNIAAITTALYVPFTSYDSGVVATVYGVNVRAYATESDPQAVAKRTIDVYRSELAKTLDSATRMYEEQKRRGTV